ncbi:MAG: zinc-ribbon domain-containing protein [Cellvibrio sp.]|nr:zinc-ribbon domain-containing protein [Cellvibrio sp.]
MTLASTSNTMVTRCPKCSTAFRITAAQLESAKGAVRCGSCLHVFKAQSHLVTKPASVPAPANQQTCISH